MADPVIGPYQILEEIGHGGMGVVYKALDTKLNRPVAIKALKIDDGQDENSRKRFMREAITVARLDHPYICKLYEVFEHEGLLYMVLEYVRGRSLADIISSRDPMPLEKVLELGTEIAEALEEAHKNGVVHRDIKPQNIMLLDSGHVKVLDFGLAKGIEKPAEMAASASLTSTGAVLGTLTYMSPEQLMGQQVDLRSDIFSFGVMLYELVAGQRPFPGKTQAEVASSIIRAEFEPLHRFRRGVPENLNRVIGRMLEKDSAERYQSVHEVWVELRRIREELISQSSRQRAAAQAVVGGEAGGYAPTVIESPSFPSVPSTVPEKPAEPAVAGPGRRRFLTRSRQWLLGFVSALGIVAILVFIIWYQNNRVALSFEPRDWVLISDFENLTGDSIFEKSLATALNVSLAQSTHANVFSRSRANEVLRRMGKNPDTAVDEQTGREICQRESIRGLICPTIGRVGNRFVITARIVDPQTGDSVRSYAEQANDYNQVLTALDGVSKSLRRGLGESFAQVRASSKALEKVTTSSLSALNSYSEARLLWVKGQYKPALDLMLSVIKEDPDFAMAHAALGVYYSSHIFNENSKAKEHYEKSLSLAGRTTDREKMMIRLQYEAQFGTPDQAYSLYESYLRFYPDDVLQRHNYAIALRSRRELDRAVQQEKEVIRVAPDFAAAHINLATAYFSQEKCQEALASYERAFRLEPTWTTLENLNSEYGFTLVAAGELEKARKVFEQGLSTSIKAMALRSLALLDMYQGKYNDARSKLNEALLLNISQKILLNESRNRLFLSIVLEGMGDSSGARRELERAAACLESLSPQVWLSSRIGIAFTRGRSIEKAARILGRLREEANSNDPIQNSSLHRLEGEIAVARGELTRGLELLMLADKDQRSGLTIESLARAQQISGKSDDAIASYEALLAMRRGALGWEPQQCWIAAHIELAKLYVSRKEEEKARRVLQEFLGLWKSADEGLPLSKEARILGKTLSLN